MQERAVPRWRRHREVEAGQARIERGLERNPQLGGSGERGMDAGRGARAVRADERVPPVDHELGRVIPRGRRGRARSSAGAPCAKVIRRGRATRGRPSSRRGRRACRPGGRIASHRP